MKSLTRYLRLLFKQVYRPIKPLVSPLVSRIKMRWVLVTIVVLAIGGSLMNGWSLSSQERAGYWPWFSKTHAELAVYWFEVGNEKKAIEELGLANKTLLIKTTKAKERITKAEDKVLGPEKIREEIRSWEKILDERPFFRDVLLRLSILNYQIYEDEKAKDYFTQAEYLDPTNKEIKEVKKIIFPL